MIIPVPKTRIRGAVHGLNVIYVRSKLQPGWVPPIRIQADRMLGNKRLAIPLPAIAISARRRATAPSLRENRRGDGLTCCTVTVLYNARTASSRTWPSHSVPLRSHHAARSTAPSFEIADALISMKHIALQSIDLGAMAIQPSVVRSHALFVHTIALRAAAQAYQGIQRNRSHADNGCSNPAHVHTRSGLLGPHTQNVF